MHLPPVPQHPPLRRLADALLDGKLDEFVRTRRAAGLSWRRIEREIWTVTGSQVDVTHVTLRAWFPDLPAGSAKLQPKPRKKRVA